MIDLVERLRRDLMDISYDDIAAMVREAADEIEQLREENKFLRGLVADELRALNPTKEPKP